MVRNECYCCQKKCEQDQDGADGLKTETYPGLDTGEITQKRVLQGEKYKFGSGQRILFGLLLIMRRQNAFGYALTPRYKGLYPRIFFREVNLRHRPLSAVRKTVVLVWTRAQQTASNL